MKQAIYFIGDTLDTNLQPEKMINTERFCDV